MIVGIVVYELGSWVSCFVFVLVIMIGVCFFLMLFFLGCWNNEIFVLWKEFWVVDELGLWFMLFIVVVVNIFLFSLGGYIIFLDL